LAASVTLPASAVSTMYRRARRENLIAFSYASPKIIIFSLC
jgi:hypothetical protein